MIDKDTDINAEPVRPKITDTPKPEAPKAVDLAHGFLKPGESKRGVIEPGKKVNFYPLAKGGFVYINADRPKVLAQFIKRHLVIKDGLATFKR